MNGDQRLANQGRVRIDQHANGRRGRLGGTDNTHTRDTEKKGTLRVVVFFVCLFYGVQTLSKIAAHPQFSDWV